MKLKIFLDIDNVIADWTSHAIRTMNLDPHHPELRTRLESQETICSIVDQTELWDLIKNGGPEWWYNIPMFPWGRKLWDICNTIAPTAFLSTPWHGHGSEVMEKSASGKVKWIREHFNTNNFFLGVHKEFFASPNALLIDDSLSNCIKFRDAGGYAFHWPSPLKIQREQNWNAVILNLMAYINFAVMNNPTNEEINKLKIVQSELRRDLK